MKHAGVALLFVVGGVRQNNSLPEAASVNDQYQQSDPEPDDARNLGGRTQTQPDDGAEHKA